jgi:hypothetical protein
VKTWADFYEYVRPQTPGAESPLLDLMLRNAAIDFFRETEVMTSEQVLNLLADQSVYDTTNPAHTEATRIKEFVFENNSPLRPITLMKLQRLYSSWRDVRSQPTHYFQQTPRQIVVFPKPDANYDAVLNKVLVPTRASIGIEDEYYNEYVEAIANGAIARIMRVPNKPYTNMEMANVYGVLFQTAIRNHKIEANRSFTNADITVEFNKIT